MKFTIDTLLLDLQFQGAGVSAQPQQIKKIEIQLKALIENAFSQMSLSSMPDWLALLQEKTGALLQSSGSQQSLTIESLEIKLPLIDAEAFLRGAKDYFERVILPELQRAFNQSVQRAIQKACALQLNAATPKAAARRAVVDSIGEEELTGQALTAADLFSAGLLNEKDWPKLLRGLKASAQYRERFKQALLTPSLFARVANALFKRSKEQPELLRSVLTVLFPELKQAHYFALIEHPKLSQEQQKQQLKRYLQWLITAPEQAPSPASRSTQTAVAVDMLLRTAFLERVAAGEGVDVSRFNQHLAGLQQALLIAQDPVWLKAAEHWLNIVLQQGVKPSDLIGLERLLKKAKGGDWRPPALTVVSAAVSADSNSSHNLKQRIVVQQGLWALIAPLQEQGLSLAYVQNQIEEISHYLARHQQQLPADIVLLVKQAFFHPAAVAAEQPIALGQQPWRLTSRIQEQLQRLSDSLLLVAMPRRTAPANDSLTVIVNNLKQIQGSPWLPLNTDDRLQKLSDSMTARKVISGGIKEPLLTLQKELANWAALLPTLLPAVEQPHPIASIRQSALTHDASMVPPVAANSGTEPAREQTLDMPVLTALLQTLQVYMSDLAGRRHSALTAAAEPWLHIMVLNLLQLAAHLPLPLQRLLSQFIQTANKTTAAPLAAELAAVITTAPAAGVAMNTLLKQAIHRDAVEQTVALAQQQRLLARRIEEELHQLSESLLLDATQRRTKTTSDSLSVIASSLKHIQRSPRLPINSDDRLQKFSGSKAPGKVISGGIKQQLLTLKNELAEKIESNRQSALTHDASMVPSVAANSGTEPARKQTLDMPVLTALLQSLQAYMSDLVGRRHSVLTPASEPWLHIMVLNLLQVAARLPLPLQRLLSQFTQTTNKTTAAALAAELATVITTAPAAGVAGAKPLLNTDYQGPPPRLEGSQSVMINRDAAEQTIALAQQQRRLARRIEEELHQLSESLLLDATQRRTKTASDSLSNIASSLQHIQRSPMPLNTDDRLQEFSDSKTPRNVISGGIEEQLLTLKKALAERTVLSSALLPASPAAATQAHQIESNRPSSLTNDVSMLQPVAAHSDTEPARKQTLDIPLLTALLQSLQAYISDLVGRRHSALTPPSDPWLNIMVFNLVLAAERFPLSLQRQLKQFIQAPNKTTATPLAAGLATVITTAPAVAQAGAKHQRQKLGPPPRLEDSPPPQAYRQVFSAEWEIQQQIQRLLMALLDSFNNHPSPAASSGPTSLRQSLSNQSISLLFEHARPNKQQLYVLLIQLITHMSAWCQQNNTAFLNRSLDKLYEIKNRLLTLAPTLAAPDDGLGDRSGEHWWLPLAEKLLNTTAEAVGLERSVIAGQAADRSAGRSERMAIAQLQPLIWHADLKQASKVLKTLAVDPSARKDSEQLLGAYRKKIAALTHPEKTQAISQRIKKSLPPLYQQQAEMQQGLACIDAGLVLLWPYLAGFFQNNNLLTTSKADHTAGPADGAEDEGLQFKDQAAQLKAHGLLVYLLGGEQTDQVYTVANLLVGLEPDSYIENAVELSEQEQTGAEQLLTAVINNWPALKNMPMNSFRELFLVRNAQFSHSESGCIVDVEAKTLDILLTKLPWGLGYISLPWRGKELIQVQWSYGY